MNGYVACLVESTAGFIEYFIEFSILYTKLSTEGLTNKKPFQITGLALFFVLYHPWVKHRQACFVADLFTKKSVGMQDRASSRLGFYKNQAICLKFDRHAKHV